MAYCRPCCSRTYGLLGCCLDATLLVLESVCSEIVAAVLRSKVGNLEARDRLN